MKKKLYTVLIGALCAASAQGQIISTYAGNGIPNYTGDGGAATAATISNPTTVNMDAAGNMYLADKMNHVIRKITPSGTITTVAGSGISGWTGDGGAATAAMLYEPLEARFDAAGNMYISDFGNSRIRKVTPSGIISTIAGTGSAGFSGDGGPATAAQLSQATSIVVDAANNIIVCDYGNSRIRKIDGAGNISTIAGSTSGFAGDGGPATAARFEYPNGLCLDPMGNLYITDMGNMRIRKIDVAGNISTIAGSGLAGYTGDGGPATAARIFNPAFLNSDDAGNIFFGDMSNAIVRRVSVSGIINTVAGTPESAGFSGDGGFATSAQLSNPTGVCMDAGNNIYIPEQANHRIRKISAVPVTITGTSTVCAGATTTLSQNVSDNGVWLSSNVSVATVNKLTGVVTGVSAGTATISFSLGGGLGTKLVTVNPAPNPGVVTGAGVLCVGSTTALSTSGTGGTWMTSNATIAAVSATGVVTGMTAGAVTISYVATNSCGTASALHNIMVGCTGIAEHGSDNTISVFPDPANGSFNISLPASATMPALITLVNSVGQVVKEMKVVDNNKVMMDAHVRPGIYLLSVTTPNGHYTTRVMISN